MFRIVTLCFFSFSLDGLTVEFRLVTKGLSEICEAARRVSVHCSRILGTFPGMCSEDEVDSGWGSLMRADW